MPRPRVKDEDRKRVAKACNICKRRKEKCDGGDPCLLCVRRGRETVCTYALPRQRRGRNVRSNTSDSDTTPALKLGKALADASPDDAEIAIESLLTLSGSRSAPKTPVTESMYDPNLAHAPVPKLARLLRDGNGKFIFVGDSSNLAFLQNIRRLARTVIGECALTADPMRHAMIEATPQSALTPETASLVHLKPTRAEAEELVHHYILAASGVVDLFDKADILQHLESWTADSSTADPNLDAIFYLVLAVGARNLRGDNDAMAERYFNRGRGLATTNFMDDPSVLTVQSYVLIAFYLLTCCRRNGAFMLLGLAIRAAYALGLHRSDVSALFEKKERQTRERVWKSLRVLDLFMSSSLGRPPATSEVDGGNVSWESKGRVYEDIRMGAAHSSAMLKICFIFERILNEVYCRREVDVQLVDSICTQYRDWNMALDAGLDVTRLKEDEVARLMPGLPQMIGMAHLKGAYYWSIILLTRPFLIFDVSTKISKNDEGAKTALSSKLANADTTSLSEACIDAALKSIEIASDLVHSPGCPKCPFMVTNSLFVSGLVIGLAMFGDYDKYFPLLSSLEQARLVLGQLAKHDPSGRRFFMITNYLQQAALEHIRRREDQQTQRSQQVTCSVFEPIRKSEPTTAQADAKDRTDTVAAGIPSQPSLGQVQGTPLAPGLDETPYKKGQTLTTSGTLAETFQDTSNLPLNIDPSLTSVRLMGSSMNNYWGPSDTNAMSDPFHAEEFPLFSLMDDYTTDDSFMDMF